MGSLPTPPGHLPLASALGTEQAFAFLQPPEGGADGISVNPVTKLTVPGPNRAMLPASGHAGPIPPDDFVHPDTGRVLSQAGNLGHDLQAATLVPTTGLRPGEP